MPIQQLDRRGDQVVESLPCGLQRQRAVDGALTTQPVGVQVLLRLTRLRLSSLAFGRYGHHRRRHLGLGCCDEVAQGVVAALEELARHGGGNLAVEATHGSHRETDVEGQPASRDTKEVADRRLEDLDAFTRRVWLHERAQTSCVQFVVVRRSERRQHAGNHLAAVCRRPHVVQRIRRCVPVRSKCPHPQKCRADELVVSATPRVSPSGCRPSGP